MKAISSLINQTIVPSDSIAGAEIMTKIKTNSALFESLIAKINERYSIDTTHWVACGKRGYKCEEISISVTPLMSRTDIAIDLTTARTGVMRRLNVDWRYITVKNGKLITPINGATIDLLQALIEA